MALPQKVLGIFSKPFIVKLAVLVLFFAFTVAVLYPRSVDMKGRLHAGPDPKVLIWTMTWVHHQLLNDPINLYRANIFYPNTDALAYSDSVIAPSLLALPLLFFTSEPTVVFNASFLIAFTLAAFGMFLLVRYLTGRTAIAVIAGVLFAFTPYRLDSITHLQYASHEWLPYVLLFMIRFFRERRRRWAFAAMAALWMQAMSCATYFVMFSLPLALFVIMLWIAFPLDRRSIAWLLISGAVLLLFLAPFYYPFYRITQELGLGPDLQQVLVFSPDLLDYAQQPKYLVSPPYDLLPARVRTPYFTLFPGFLAAAAILFALGMFFTTRPSAPKKGEEAGKGITRAFGAMRWLVLALTALSGLLMAAYAVSPPSQPNDGFTLLTGLLWCALIAWLFAAFVAAVGVGKGRISFEGFALWAFLSLAVLNSLFALGPQLHIRNVSVAQNVYWPLFSFLPGFGTIRQPMHFNTNFVLFAVAAAGVALKRLEKLPKVAGVALLVGMFVWIGFEYQVDTTYNHNRDPNIRNRHDWVEVPLLVPEFYRWLAAEPAASPFIELPVWGPPHHPETDRMYWSMYHWRPMVTGQLSYWPPEYMTLYNEMSAFPSRRSIKYLQDNYALRFLVIRTRHYNHRQIQEAIELLGQPFSHYRFVDYFDDGYFLVYENSRWDESLYYTVDPPR